MPSQGNFHGIRDFSDHSSKTKGSKTEIQYSKNLNRYDPEISSLKDDFQVLNLKQEAEPKIKSSAVFQSHAPNLRISNNHNKSTERISEKSKEGIRATINDPLIIVDTYYKSTGPKIIEQQNGFHHEKRKSIIDKENINTTDEVIGHTPPVIYKYPGHLRNPSEVNYDDENHSPAIMKGFNNQKLSDYPMYDTYDIRNSTTHNDNMDTCKSRNHSISNMHNRSVNSNMGGESTLGETKYNIEEKLKDLEFKLRDVEMRNKGLKVEKSKVEVELEKLLLDLKEKSKSNDPNSQESIMILQNEVKYLIGVIMDNQVKYNDSKLECSRTEVNKNNYNNIVSMALNQLKSKDNLSASIENFTKNVNINFSKYPSDQHKNPVNVSNSNKVNSCMSKNISNTSPNLYLSKADKNGVFSSRTSNRGSGKLMEIMRQRSANLKEHLSHKVTQSFSDNNNCNLDNSNFMFSSYNKNNSILRK